MKISFAIEKQNAEQLKPLHCIAALRQTIKPMQPYVR
jgi:hypothetical protein